MKFQELSLYFQKLESTPSRNAMTQILADLFEKAGVEEIDKICYLTQGRVAPLFVPLEFGVADRMMVKAISQAYEVEEKQVEKVFKDLGDLGLAATNFSIAASQSRSKSSGHSTETDLNKGAAVRQHSKIVARHPLLVSEVFEILKKVATSSGEGSVEQKTKLLADLLKSVDPLSARYIVRIPLGKLRLGFSDMTILDALSWMTGKGKDMRPTIEKAYNVKPDLGLLAKKIKNENIKYKNDIEKLKKSLNQISPQPGIPILMARAERLSSGKEIIEKIGKCAIEPKIDGFRLAVHKTGDKIRMFSRNMEDVTHMYPDLVEGVRKQINAREVILEGEAIAYNPKTGEYLPFQETVQRKRKYDIEKMAEAVPLKLICFDCLYVNGKNLINEPFMKRRRWLERIYAQGLTLGTIILSEIKIAEKPEEVEQVFDKALAKGLEGIMAKRLDGEYQAGARGWNWIKYKRSYAGKLEDTIDAVVMGYDFGQGKRAGFGIGDFLIGVYEQKTDTFKTIAKIGTGLTDEEWRQLKIKSEKIKIKNKPVRYEVDKAMGCDVWVEPKMVVVIRADEITRSPVHTAGRLMGLSKSGGAQEVKIPGFALRFPRLVDFRDDKTPEDATTLKEIEEMYRRQGKKKAS